MAPGGRPPGFALIIVLWTVVLLTLLVTQLTTAGQTEARLASNLRGAAQAAAYADGCVYETVWQLLQQPGSIGLRQRQLPGARATIALGSEDGKFDLNAISLEALAALLRAVGVERAQATQLAADVVLWRYPSSQTDERRRAYQQAGLSYGPPGASFQSVSELSFVLGMTPEIVARLRPHVSVVHQGDPNPELADPIVREVARTQGVRPAGGRQGGAIWDVDITVETDGGSRAFRHAVIRIGAQADRGLWRILDWR